MKIFFLIEKNLMMGLVMVTHGSRGLYGFCFGGLTTLLSAVAATCCIAAETPVVIDYMVLYTPAAEVRAGGESAILTRIYNGVDTVNEALSRSGLGYISYRLVHVERLSGNNTSTDLSLAIQEVNVFAPILEMRDQYHADSVSLLFEQITPGAYGSIPLSAGQAKNSQTYFGVFNYGSFTTAHELGHNMGGFHDNPEPEPPESTVLYGSSPYGYNFRGTDGIYYRTIMSYGVQPDPENIVEIVNCGYYSNPQITYQGHPTGREGYADMAAAIRYWAPIISTTNTAPPQDENAELLLGPILLLLNSAAQ